MLKKAFMLVTGNAFASALLLIRNLIVARLISPDDYGIASTFAISMSIVEMMSYLGLQQLMVVDKEGDDPQFQNAMQGFQVLRGVFSAVVMYLIAVPYARFMGIEDVAWTFQVMSVVPLMNALQHFDQHRMKRHMNFRPSILIGVIPAIISVILIWPIALMFNDYQIMLWSMILQTAATVILSHVLAERPYRLTLVTAVIRRSMVFGWPLLLNGVMLFAVFNGEKLIVGRELGMAELAVFSMAFTLTLTPTLILGNSIQTMFLSQLSKAQDRQAEFQRVGVVTIEASLVIGILLVVGVSLLAGPVIGLALGPKYAAMLDIIVPMAILQGVRSGKTGSSVVALARKRSGNSIAANVFRVGALPLAWWIAIRTGNIILIIWVGVFAELLGFLLSLYLVRKRVGISVRPVLVPVLMVGLVYVTAGYFSYRHPPAAGILDNLSWGQAILVSNGVAALLSMTGLRKYAMRRLRR